jgi:hypothetical protein
MGAGFGWHPTPERIEMPNLTEAEVVAQLSAQHTTYTTGATGTPVQTAQNARMALDNSAKTAKTNAQFSTLNGTEAPGTRVTGKVYTGGNVVAPVNATYFEARVRTNLDAGTIFTYGGPYTSDYALASPYVDGLALIEASKLTGEKFF